MENCFDDDGNLTFDPYRCDHKSEQYQALFNDEGYLLNRYALGNFIYMKRWDWKCDAVGLYHAQTLAFNTKGSYPTYYFCK